MSARPFALAPFPGGPALPFGIGGRVTRQGDRLTLVYELAGAVTGVAWPSPATAPERRDQLWQATCAECFVARPGEGGYWEANFSPSGHWQLYRFDDYRQGMRPATAIAAPTISAARSDDSLSLAATLDLGSLLPAESALLLGVTMVVRTMDGSTSYWALAHPGEKPDFHLRAGFCLSL